MDSLGKIVEKMEAPLIFMAEGGLGRLSLVRNLETVVTSLAQRAKNKVNGDIPESQGLEIKRIASCLMKLFNGYDCMPPECKKGRLVEAIRYVTELKAIVKNLPVKQDEIGRSSELRSEGDTSDLLAGHVQSALGQPNFWQRRDLL